MKKKPTDDNIKGRDGRGRFTKGTAGHRLAAPRPVRTGMTLPAIVCKLTDQYRLAKTLVQRALIGDMRAVELVLDFVKNAPAPSASQYDPGKLSLPQNLLLDSLLKQASTEGPGVSNPTLLRQLRAASSI